MSRMDGFTELQASRSNNLWLHVSTPSLITPELVEESVNHTKPVVSSVKYC